MTRLGLCLFCEIMWVFALREGQTFWLFAVWLEETFEPDPRTAVSDSQFRNLFSLQEPLQQSPGARPAQAEVVAVGLQIRFWIAWVYRTRCPAHIGGTHIGEWVPHLHPNTNFEYVVQRNPYSNSLANTQVQDWRRDAPRSREIGSDPGGYVYVDGWVHRDASIEGLWCQSSGFQLAEPNKMSLNTSLVWCGFGMIFLGDCLPPFSVAFVKGWRRTLSCMIACEGIRRLSVPLDQLTEKFKEWFWLKFALFSNLVAA